MLVAISMQPESEKVERFGHPVPVLLVDVEGMDVKGTRLLAVDGQGNDELIAALEGSKVLICAGLEDDEAHRINELGVSVAVVREGVDASMALSWFVHQANGGGCCGGHGHGCVSRGENEEGCGCGGHGENEEGCGCGGGCCGDDESDDSASGCGCCGGSHKPN